MRADAEQNEQAILGPSPERRAYPRVPSAGFIRIYTAPAEGWIPATLEACLENLSRGGALVDVKHDLDGERSCLVEFGGDGIVPDKVTGTVRRAQVGRGPNDSLIIEFNRPLRRIGV